MTPEEAVVICARKVARLQLEELPDEWEVFAPEIGEYDWGRIVETAKGLVPDDVSDEQYSAAFKMLEARANTTADLMSVFAAELKTTEGE